MIQPQLDLLLAWASKANTADIVEAKGEYFQHTGGEVHEDDRCFEQRTQAFFNWYLFDRKGRDGATPVERYLREQGPQLAARDKEVLIGCTQTRPGIYEYRGRGGGLFGSSGKNQVRVRDAISGQKYDVTERRQMHGMEIGDLFEARLIPVARTWHFSTSFTYHPREVKQTIVREIKRRKKTGEPIDPLGFSWELERMSLQHERFRNVSIDAIYNFETPFLSKKPRAEAEQGG